MGRVAWVLVVVAACHAPRPPELVPTVVHAETPVCIDARALDGELARVLAQHHASASGLVIEVRAEPSASGADVALRVLRRAGDVGLERHYALSTGDCASAVAVVALAIDRWLTAFPEWALPPLPPEPRPERGIAASAMATASAGAPPLDAEGELGVRADLGGDRDRFGLAALARTNWPLDVAGGRVREVTVLGGATWRHRFGAWQLGLELRGGALRVNGLGFLRDHSDWLPWWEIAVVGERRFGRGAAGLEVAASALRDHATTRDGLISQELPFVRVGLTFDFAFLER